MVISKYGRGTWLALESVSSERFKPDCAQAINLSAI